MTAVTTPDGHAADDRRNHAANEAIPPAERTPCVADLVAVGGDACHDPLLLST